MTRETERERRQQEEILRLTQELVAARAAIAALQSANADLHERAEIWRAAAEQDNTHAPTR